MLANPSIREAEAGELQMWGQPGLLSWLKKKTKAIISTSHKETGKATEKAWPETKIAKNTQQAKDQEETGSHSATQGKADDSKRSVQTCLQN